MVPKKDIDVETILKKLQINTTPEDLQQLKTNIVYLLENGLSELNYRLLLQNKPENFLDALTEHNFTVNLLNNLPSNKSIRIRYEPFEAKGIRSPDLHVVLDEVNYWIQIKRLSRLKHENLQDKFFREFKRRIKKIKINKFIAVTQIEAFTDENMEEFVEFINSKASIWRNNIEYEFVTKQDILKALFTFQEPNAVKLDGLTLNFGDDLYMTDVTGLAEEQIKKGFGKSAEAFQSASASHTVNLIVAECYNIRTQSIDFCNALYGTECCTFDTNTRQNGLTRRTNGLFMKDIFSNQVSGVIAIFRENHNLMSQYSQVLCINPRCEQLISPIENLLKIEKVIRQDTYLKNDFLS